MNTSAFAKGRREKGITVFVNGCFDPLHHGHIAMLRAAKALGDFLIVGINTDESVSSIKGIGHPRFPLSDRIASLRELKCVDDVVSFSQSTASELISIVHPDIVVKGGDYGPDSVVERSVIDALGAELRFANYEHGVSSTSLTMPRSGSSTAEDCVTVITDLAIDRYRAGVAATLSREFGIAVCQNPSEIVRLGGGGNLAVNFHRLNSLGRLFAMVGTGDADNMATSLLAESGIPISDLLSLDEPIIGIFEKYLSHVQGSVSREFFRIDVVPRVPAIEAVRCAFQHRLEDLEKWNKVVVCSLYSPPKRSLLAAETRGKLSKMCRQNNKTLIGACRFHSKSLSGCDYLVMNEQEFLSETNPDSDVLMVDEDLLAKHAGKFGTSSVVVTLGESGAIAFDSRSNRTFRSHTQRCPPGTDPTGAGDVFLACFATAIALGADLLEATQAGVCEATHSLFQEHRPAIVDLLSRWRAGDRNA